MLKAHPQLCMQLTLVPVAATAWAWSSSPPPPSTTAAALFSALDVAADQSEQIGAGKQLSFRHVTEYGDPFWLAVGPTGPAQKTKHQAALPAGGINNKLYESGHFHEHQEALLVHRILESQCNLKSGTPPRLVDVGANSGFFTLLGAAHGCSVTSVEPNRVWASLVRMSIEVNGFGSRVSLHNAVCTNESSVVFNGWEVTRNLAQSWQNKIKMRKWAVPSGSVRLDDILPLDQPIAYLKIDTQGHEGSARSTSRFGRS